MAIVHVSTWADFKTAIGVSGDTVIVDNDLDANGDNISTTIYVNATEIDGAGHTLYNLTSRNTSIFYIPTYSCTIHDLNFYNVYQVSNGTAGNAIFTKVQTGANWTIENCKFQGDINEIAQGRAYISQCAISLSGKTRKYKIAQVNNGTLTLNQCYIDIGQDYYSTESELISATSVINCYFKGKIDVSNITASLYYVIRAGTTAENNVVNTDISTTNRTPTIAINNSSGISLYNLSKIQADLSVQAVTGLTGLSDTDLKTPSAVADTGFPLIV